MHLTYRNVNDAFLGLVGYFHKPERWDSTCGVGVVSSRSRNGNVSMIPEPVLITYQRPLERVLFNQARDCNPFALLYEALWMLAGRNDVESLAYYTKQFAEYSDDGRTLNGAYGYRWRAAKGAPNLWTSGGEPGKSVRGYNRPGVDQLNLLVGHLKAQPDSRRAVLQMWNVEDDLLKIGLGGACNCGADRTGPSAEAHSSSCPAKAPSRDVCCNLSVMFSLREYDHWDEATRKSQRRYLDITVTNRSNDLVWGMLGTNYVCFSILQEYMAAQLGVSVGQYHHFTNNLHVYDWNWKPQEWLVWYDRPVAVRSDWYEGEQFIPLVKDPAVFDKEVQSFVDDNGDGSWFNHPSPTEQVMQAYKEPFLMHVAQPMCVAYHQHKHGRREEALSAAGYIKADDWRITCTSWLERRYNKKEASQ